MEKNFINAQIKELRKTLKLNQAEFGERIGLKAGAIGKMEKDGGTVIEQNIKLICEKFNVRREWLVNGTGEMLQETEDALFASFVERYNLNEDEQVLARYILNLTAEDRQRLIAHIEEVSEMLRQRRERKAAAQSAPGSFTAEELAVYEKVKAAKEQQNSQDPERAALHQELDEALDEKEAASAASASKDSSAKWA